MFQFTRAFSGFAVNDIERAREFYSSTLGVESSEHNGLLTLQLPDGRETIIYPKADHEPANYTILNFAVEDIEEAVAALSERGVQFERYENFEQDEHGIFRGGGPYIAWFTDPSGNILSVLQER